MFFEALNLPPYVPRLRKDPDGSVRIFDPLRDKWLVLTPEERVRQHFVNYLVEDRHFPRGLMANEVSLRLNDTLRRCDTLIYTRHLSPLCIVEYKRPGVEVTAAVFDQIARYNSVLGARYLIVSNGLRHYCCRFDGDGYTFLRTIPSYEEMISSDI